LSNFTRPARKYKIAYLIDGLSMGGAERLTVPILKHLDRAYFEPYVCAMQSKDDNPMAAELSALGVPVECLNIRHLRDLNAIPHLTRYLKGIRADIVHTQLEAANILGNLSAKLLGLASISTIHIMPSLNVKTKTRLHQKVEWFVLRHFCDHVISVSDEARRYHIQVSGSSAGQTTTIYNGIDLSAFFPMDAPAQRVAVRNELHIPPDANVLVTVAVLRPPKGIEYMIRALPAVLASHPNTSYLIVGSGPHQDVLIQEANKAGVEPRVVFAGMRRDVPRMLAASDVFVLPTLTEALPTVLAEAMAARLPIVASRVGGIPEMVTNGQNGFLLAPQDANGLADACTHLLDNPEKRLDMGAEGWKIVSRKFNIERQVEQLKQLYVQQLQAYGKT